MAMKNMLDDWKSWMTKSTMPLGRRNTDTAENLNWGRTNGV
jgi:hypothetical protein